MRSIDLKEHRRRKKITQKELADKIGITASYYSMIEGKKRRPSIEVAKKMAKVLGFPDDWPKLY